MNHQESIICEDVSLESPKDTVGHPSHLVGGNWKLKRVAMSEPSRERLGRAILESRKDTMGILLIAIKLQKLGSVARMSEPSGISPWWRVHVDSRKDTRMCPSHRSDKDGGRRLR